ncbi:hypothetical protein [Streptomyces sp. NPDC001307]|uniref:hypothetical protein n=1 Tax=Streptomyces sp. NPDC001307 TaxID=3364560 RepID=UPI00369E46EB
MRASDVQSATDQVRGSLWRTGGQAELHVWPGGCHGYDTFAPRAALSQDTREARTRWLRRALTRT